MIRSALTASALAYTWRRKNSYRTTCNNECSSDVASSISTERQKRTNRNHNDSVITMKESQYESSICASYMINIDHSFNGTP